MGNKYKFENHSAELVDPIIESLTPTYKLGDAKVQVHAVLNSNGNKLYGVHLGEMDNTNSWTDADVSAFAIKKLNDFKVV